MKLRLTSTTVGLAAGISAVVVAVCSTAAYFYSAHHSAALIETARANALANGELIRVALEHQMMENDRSLIGRMIRSFGKQPKVERVVLLDRTGVERYSSLPNDTAEDFQIHSPTCQACHRDPPGRRASSRVIETRGGAVLRTVVPIRNRPECYRCHDSSHGINGILIVDYDAGDIRASMNRDLRWMVAGAGAMTLLLVSAIAALIQMILLRRLRRMETTARSIAGGDLNRRVPVEGIDTLSWLAREFNTMADSVTGLVREVREQRERLETVINSIGDGIVVLDEHRRIIAANDAFLTRTSSRRDEVLGCGCRDMGPGACTVADCPSLACLRTGTPQVRICERRTSEGAVAWEEVHASPVLNPVDRRTQVVEVWRDISERRAAEARLAESHRMASLGLLASGFSHELNTPLATVLACVEGILRELSGDGSPEAAMARTRENASIAREQILRCRGITQHFLRLSRAESSSGDIVEVGPAIAAVTRLIEPTARRHSIVIESRPAPSSLRMQIDEAGLQNTLINLLLNAIQASQPGGRVQIEAAGGNPIHIRVVDQGRGIAPEHLDRIFEPFFSLREGGTGLGLFLSLNFVRRWGGDLHVTSTEGEGAAFEVVLPALEGQEAPR